MLKSELYVSQLFRSVFDDKLLSQYFPVKPFRESYYSELTSESSRWFDVPIATEFSWKSIVIKSTRFLTLDHPHPLFPYPLSNTHTHTLSLSRSLMHTHFHTIYFSNFKYTYQAISLSLTHTHTHTHFPSHTLFLTSTHTYSLPHIHAVWNAFKQRKYLFPPHLNQVSVNFHSLSRIGLFLDSIRISKSIFSSFVQRFNACQNAGNTKSYF